MALSDTESAGLTFRETRRGWDEYRPVSGKISG